MSKKKPVSAVATAEEILNPTEVAAEQPAPELETEAEIETKSEPEPEPALARVLQAFERNGQKYRPDDLALLGAEEIANLAASGFVDSHQGAVAYCQSLGKTPV